jgi:RNA polymerase sporulation-specific sigma factor
MNRCTAARLAAQEDSVLTEYAARGCEEAMQLLFARYEGIVRRRARSARIDGLEPEDLFQEGMIGFITAVRSYRIDRGASFRTYALLCITRRMASAVRSALSQKNLPLGTYISLDEELDTDTIPSSRSGNPEDMVVCREELQNFQSFMERNLTLLERRVLKLYISGRSYAAMAEILNVNTKTVDNALQRIRKKLSLKISG